MITCRIMNGEKDPALAYEAGMKHFALVPNLEEVRLLTTLDLPSIMEVLIDDQVVETRKLEKGRHLLNLALFLAKGSLLTSRSADGSASIWSWSRLAATATKSDAVKKFTVRYKNSTGGDELVATFDFEFLDSTSFKLGAHQHTVLHDRKAHASEADPNAPTWKCWDCDYRVPAHRTTCNNCAAPRNHPNSLKRRD